MMVKEKDNKEQIFRYIYIYLNYLLVKFPKNFLFEFRVL